MMRFRPNHYEEEPYRLFVDDQERSVLNRFEQRVAHVYLWGEGSRQAIWILQCCYIGGNISVRLFSNLHQNQMKFKRCEEALALIERRLGIKRGSVPPKNITPARGKTMWETEDAARAAEEGT